MKLIVGSGSYRLRNGSVATVFEEGSFLYGTRAKKRGNEETMWHLDDGSHVRMNPKAKGTGKSPYDLVEFLGHAVKEVKAIRRLHD
jgi:hypothetical protein